MAPLLQQLRRHTHLGNPAADRKKGGLFAIPERKGGDTLERSRSEVVARENPFLEEEESDDSQPSMQGVEIMDLKGPVPFATARDEYQVMVEEYEEEIQRLEKVNATLTANVVTLTAAALDSDADGTSSMGQVSVITVERCKSCGNESCSEAEEGSVRSNFVRRSSIGGMEITRNELYSPLNNDIYNDMILTEEHYLHQISKLQKNNAKLQKRLDGKKKLVSQLSMNLKTAAEKITEVGKENATLKTKVTKEKKGENQSQPPEDEAALAEQEQIHQFQVQVLENELKGLMNLVGERAKVHEEHRRALLEDYRRDGAAWKRKMEKPEDTMVRVVRRLRKGDVVDDWHVNTDAASPAVETQNEGANAKPGFSVLDSVTSLFGGSERQQPQPRPQMKGSLLPEERVRIDEHPTSEEIKGFDESSSESEESDESSSSGSSSESSSSESDEEDSVESVELVVSASAHAEAVAKDPTEVLEPAAPSGGFDNSADAGNAEFEAMKHHVFGRKEDTETGNIAPPSVPPPDWDESRSKEESSSGDASSSSSESSSDDESEVDSRGASPVASPEELHDETNPSHVGDVVLLDARDFDTPVTVDSAAVDSAAVVSEPSVPEEPHLKEEDGNDTHTANEAAQAKDHPENDTPEGDDETVVNSVPEPNGPTAVVESTDTKATAAAEAMGNGDSDGEHAAGVQRDDDCNTADGYTAQESKAEEHSVVHELERVVEDSDDEYDPKEGKDDHESDGAYDEEEQDAAATVLQSDEPRLQEEEAEVADAGATAQAETAEAHLDTNPAPEQNEGGLSDVEHSEPSTDERVAVPSKDGTFSDEPSASPGAPQEEKSESPSTELHSAKSHPETIVTSAVAISDASQVRVSAALELRYNAANKTLVDTLAMIQEQNKARMEGIDDDRSANQYHNVLSHFSKPEGAKPKKDALANRMSRRQLFQKTALAPADLPADNIHKTEDRQVLVTSRDIDKYQVPRYKPPVLPPDTKSSSASTFKKGLKDGYYVYRSSSGNTYAGQWKSGKRHGHGRAKYRDGEIYDGEWQGGRRHGHGVLHLANSEVFEGSWSANKKHGLGVYFWADGEVDVSLYEHDARLESLRWTKDRRRAYLLDLSSSSKEQISLVRAASVVKGWDKKDATLD